MWYGWYGMGFGMIFMVLFWGLIIWAIFALLRGGHGCCGGHMGHHHGEGREGRALEILKERYAKGEISKEEFERMKKELE
jgi:putative membrane protein